MREAKDRSAAWMITHHGGALLRLAQLTGFQTRRAAQSKHTHPQLLPDGLLDVSFAGRPEPVPVLIEVETYADRETEEQVLRDVAAVLLERRTLPEVITVVLRPKGQFRLSGEQTVRSAQGLTELFLKWRVIELWNVLAADLLALGDVGLLPWVPLTQIDGPTEATLQMCKERIEQQGKPEERNNLLAVAQIMTELRYNDPGLLSFLGGRKMIVESPLIQELLAERDLTSAHAILVEFLKNHFDSIPEDLAAQIRTINDYEMLKKLIYEAVSCSDLAAFRRQLPS